MNGLGVSNAWRRADGGCVDDKMEKGEKQFRWGLIFRCAGERSEGHGCDDNDGVWVT